jgi:hypothetical protein
MGNRPVGKPSLGQRQKIKEVMRFAGPRMIWYHPIWTLKHLWRER